MKKIAPIILTIYAACAIIYIGAFLMLVQISESPDAFDNNIKLNNSKNDKNKVISQQAGITSRTSIPDVTLIAVGDIMLSRWVEKTMIDKDNFKLPFEQTAEFLSSADITFGNLETAILAGREIITDEITFRTDPKSIEGLNYAGFDLLTLANNHTPNFGQEGLKNTFNSLLDNKIEFVGAGLNEKQANQPVIIEVNNMKFGFLAYTYSNSVPEFYQASENRAGTNFMDEEKLKEDINSLRNQVDWLIVSMHAGIEYAQKLSQQQKDFAHAAIDSGANIVIGHHPHVVQPAEKYKNGYIFYSLGNFIFDQPWSEETQTGLMIKLTLMPKIITNIELIPVKINKKYQAEIISGDEAEEIIKRLDIDVNNLFEKIIRS